MFATARLDYAIRALVALATSDNHLKGDRIALEHDLPLNYLWNVLGDLRRAGLVNSKRGGAGGYRLARPPGAITVGDVIRALDPTPQSKTAPTPLASMWSALDRAVLAAAEEITIQDLVKSPPATQPAQATRATER